jgi:alpha-tubulin suppressor-like RCC1 family protein
MLPRLLAQVPTTMTYTSATAVGLGALLLSTNGTVLSWTPPVDGHEQTDNEPPAASAGPASQLIGRSLATAAVIPTAIDWGPKVRIVRVSCTSHLGATDGECMGTRCIRFSGSCLAASQAGEIFEWAADSVDSDGPPVLPRRVTFAGESMRSPVSWVDLRTAGFASLALTSTGQLWSWTAFQLGEQTPDMFGGQVRNQKYTRRALSMCHDP